MCVIIVLNIVVIIVVVVVAAAATVDYIFGLLLKYKRQLTNT